MINIVNYRVGNLQNIQNAFSTLGVSSQIVDNPEELKTAEKIVLPGVGSFGYCMQMIKKYNFDEIIKEKIKQGKILLGICVGMQVLFEWGLEKKGKPQGHCCKAGGQAIEKIIDACLLFEGKDTEQEDKQ